jgi:molecular chaperone DnaK
MGKIIGIDLGTTNSVVAVMEGSEAKVITNAQGGRTTPSMVAFTDKEERLIGQRAKNQAVANPENTIYSIKRFMGCNHTEVGDAQKMVPYKMVGKGKDPVKVSVRGETYTPPQISAMILQYLKKAAEDYLGEAVTEAVITVPAYFNDAQRQATKDAGEIAGLTVRRIINEPTAASLAYGLDRHKEEKVAVFDLGGGTFDISILELSGDDEDRTIEVISTNGDTRLGGDDFDEALINYIADEFFKDKGVDLRKDRLALQRLKEACEKAKCELSASMSTQINLPYIAIIDNVPQILQLEITRAKFESLVSDLVKRCEDPCRKALKDAKLSPAEISEVIFVGGSTRMPCVHEAVERIFQKKPNKSINPDEAVAMGAAIQGSILAGDRTDLLLIDVTPLSLGIETAGEIMTVMIERNSAIPTKKTEIFTTAAPNQPAVDVKVFQGERKMARHNRLLGVFKLDGIPPAPARTPQIEVTFDIDANGILNVSAKDLGTGKEQKVTIQASSGLSKDDIEKMKREAEENAKDDEALFELAQAKNKADAIIDGTEKQFKDMEDKIPAETKTQLEEKVAAIKAVKDGDDADAINAAIEDLEKVAHAMAEELYKNAGPEAAAGAGAPPPPQEEAEAGSEEDVIDADFKVKS